MSWLARSIANSLLLDDIPKDKLHHNEFLEPRPEPESTKRILDYEDQEEHVGLGNDDDDGFGGDDEGRGVKEDLSELTETLTRQFWGVASFLAPPPPPPPPPVPRNLSLGEEVEVEDNELGSLRRGIDETEGNEVEENEEMELGNVRQVIEETLENGDEEELRKWRRGIEESKREEEEELRGWRQGIVETEREEEDELRKWSQGITEKLENGEESDNFDVSYEEEVEDAVGVTEEAFAFAQNIAHHPETWLDFPLEEEEEEGFVDFQVSHSQYKHALAIQRLVPTLAALRIELCPVHMSEGYFWMVYFVLLHSRLNKNVADQLSSLELVRARSMWREELQKRAKPDTDWFGRSTSSLHENTNSPCEDYDAEDYDARRISFNACNDGPRLYHELYNDTEKQIVECGEANLVETPSGNSERDWLNFQSPQILQEQDDEDDWVQDTEDLDGYFATGIVVNEEDVSFSDLEEDSDWTLPIKSK